MGRTAFWSSNLHQTRVNGKAGFQEQYVRRLRIYPHGLRDANAFYSPDKDVYMQYTVEDTPWWDGKPRLGL